MKTHFLDLIMTDTLVFIQYSERILIFPNTPGIVQGDVTNTEQNNPGAEDTGQRKTHTPDKVAPGCKLKNSR